jgi:hypothetical protein
MFINLRAQELTGQQLLDKTIKVHDPNGNWQSVNGTFQVTMSTPQKSDRVSDIQIDLQAQYFELNTSQDSIAKAYIIDKEKIDVFIVDLMKNEKQHYQEGEMAERAVLMKNYYTYLYGLPMKLKDKGTNIDSKVERKTFKGKEYLVLKVTYDENVGSDVWFFYYDPTTFKMEIYQFFKTDEAGKINPDSGEYILLSGNHVVNGVNMPKTRKWYYNKDDQYLGADVITK